jgi:coenzyme F420-reducing hydrogenase delta subunit
MAINTDGATAPASRRAVPEPGADRLMVAFVCENAGRRGVVPSSGIRRRPSLPDFGWPFRVQEVAVPCGGRIQPEHLLKAIEDGADAVGVICCEEGNCHHHEGNRRCQKRLDYVGKLVEQVGLGSSRLRLFHLPGSAAQDMALGVGITPVEEPSMNQKIAAVRTDALAWLATISPNPLAKGELPDEAPYEVDSEDESD